MFSQFMRYKLLTLVTPAVCVSACDTQTVELCDTVSTGMTEEEIINRLGKPYSKTEVSNDGIKGLMYKEIKFPSLVILTLKKNTENVFVLENCGHIE